MIAPSPLVRRRRLSVAASLLFVVACADGGGGGGCGGCGGAGCGPAVPYPASGAVVERAGQVRVTPQGLRFLEANTGPLVEQFLPDGLSFCIPPTSQAGLNICAVANADACTGAGTGCLFEAEILSVALSPYDDTNNGSDGLDARITLTNIDNALPVSGFLGSCPELRVRSDAFDVTARLLFDLDADGRTSIRIGDLFLDFADLEPYHELSFLDGNFLSCEAYRGAISTLGPIIAPFLGDFILPQIESQLCVQCDAGCPDGAACSGDPEVCRWTGSGECVPIPLGAEGGFDLAGSLAAFGGPEEALLYYLFYLANYADAERNGLSLGAEAGFHAEHNACVPRRPPPDTTPVPKSSELTSDVTPQGGSFMVGLGLAKRALDLAMWSFYNSGALCLSLGTDQIEQLTSSALSIILESLSDLTEGQNVPLILRIRPTEAPTVLLGSGEVLAGDPPTILDPLLTVQVRGLRIEFFAYIEERFARLFTIDTDLDVPLALTPSDDGGAIQVLLGDLEEAFTRVEAVDAELLAQQDVDRLADVLPGLIGAFVPQLAAALQDPIALPEFGGYRLALSQDSFTSIENRSMLAIFANIEAAPASGLPALHSMPLATAEIVEVQTPTSAAITDYEARRRRGDAADLEALRTTVVLEVDTLLAADDSPREYSYRFDGGPWHLYRAGNRLTLRDPELLLEGEHSVEVRSRVSGESNTLSLPSVPVVLHVDLATPEVTLRRNGSYEVEIEARDSAWDEHELSMRWRVNGGVWQAEPYVVAVPLPVDSGAQTAEVEVEVTDPAGRSTLARRTFALHGRGESDVPSTDGCANCSAAGSGLHGPTVWLWLGLFALLLAPRRKALLVVAALAALLAGCSDDPPKSSGEPDTGEPTCDDCGADQLCVNNACVDNTCAADTQCPATMACVDDRCVTRIRCETEAECPIGQFCVDDDEDGGSECLSVPCDSHAACGDLPCGGAGFPYCVEESCRCAVPCQEGCGDEQFCCRPTDSCEPVPSVCLPLACDIGFGPVVVTPGAGDPDSCQVSGPDCECRELPPLPLGDVGSYLSAAAAPDGTIYVAAFNRTYEDLMFGVVGEDGTIEWTFLDGNPATGEVTGSLNGPRGGISDAGTRVGRYTSLAVADDGVVHLSYFDRSQRNLRYARGTPSGATLSWKLETVDSTSRTGMYTSITLSGAGVPGIAYFVERVEIAPGVWHAQVRYAWADEAEPSTWTIEVVDSALLTTPCGGACAGTQRCNGAANACQPTLAAGRCVPGCGGDQCFDGADGATCGPVVPGSDLVFVPEGVGLFADSDRFDDDEVALVYYDHTSGTLRYVASSAQSFEEQAPAVLDGDPTTDVGWYPSVTVAPDQSVHVTYVDAQNDHLVYGNVTEGTREIIDSGVRGTADTLEPVLVGDDSSLVVLGDGTLQAAYMDSSKHDVLVARRSSEGLWLAPATLLGAERTYAGAFGFYLNQLLVDGQTVLLTYRINTREATRDVVVRTVE